jgi:lipoate-protein ligase A
MHYLDLTLPTPAENLALDEALLEDAEAASQPLETLRFWEPSENMAVVGRSSYIDVEVNREACRELGIPILRRVSGGAAILTGPGCLMYALVLSYENRPGLRTVGQIHAFVLDTLAKALAPLVPGVRFCGTSDLAIEGKGVRSNLCEAPGTDGHHPQDGRLVGPFRQIGHDPFSRKFSGNSMRCRHKHFLYHGTLLYDFPLEMISRCLKSPPRMPDYRGGREHTAFVANLPVPAESIRQALISAWNAIEPCDNWPRELASRLVNEKYGNPQWNELL